MCRLAGIRSFIYTHKFFDYKDSALRIVPHFSLLCIDSDLEIRKESLNGLKLFLNKIEENIENQDVMVETKPENNEGSTMLGWAFNSISKFVSKNTGGETQTFKVENEISYEKSYEKSHEKSHEESFDKLYNTNDDDNIYDKSQDTEIFDNKKEQIKINSPKVERYNNNTNNQYNQNYQNNQNNQNIQKIETKTNNQNNPKNQNKFDENTTQPSNNKTEEKNKPLVLGNTKPGIAPFVGNFDGWDDDIVFDD